MATRGRADLGDADDSVRDVVAVDDARSGDGGSRDADLSGRCRDALDAFSVGNNKREMAGMVQWMDIGWRTPPSIGQRL